MGDEAHGPRRWRRPPASGWAVVKPGKPMAAVPAIRAAALATAVRSAPSAAPRGGVGARPAAGAAAVVGGRPPSLAAAVDRHVGQRLRERRIQLGLSLAQLAAALGVSTQQVRKYEAGCNGLPASRLADLAAVLGVEMGWLFEGLSPEGDGAAGYVPGLPTRPRMLLDIVRNFERIEGPERQAALCEAARALAAASDVGAAAPEDDADAAPKAERPDGGDIALRAAGAPIAMGKGG